MFKRTSQRRRTSETSHLSQGIHLEGLEGRTLLSASVSHLAHANLHALHKPAATAKLHQAAYACGSVVSVDTSATPNTITLSVAGKHGAAATSTTYNVDPAATITADGSAVTLDKLVAGVKVKLQLGATDPTTATSIVAVGQGAEGAVTAVNTTANTITLAGRKGGTPTTYNIGATTTVTVDGATGTLAGISVGSKVELKLSALDPTAVLSVNARTAPPGGHGEGQHHQQRFAGGSVVSVDTAATPNTITLSVAGEHGAAATSTTYNVDPAATITADGGAVTLDKLVAGVKVKLQLSATDPTTATSITAVGQEAEGAVTAVDTTANTITLAGRDGGTPTTYNIGASTTITVDGVTGTLAGISVGNKVELKLSALDATAVLSVNARTISPGGGHGHGFGPGGGGPRGGFDGDHGHGGGRHGGR